MKPICRNIQNNDLYEYEGGNKFTNLRTKVSGSVPEDKAAEILKFNIEATKIINEYPVIKEMINKIDLKIIK